MSMVKNTQENTIKALQKALSEKEKALLEKDKIITGKDLLIARKEQRILTLEEFVRLHKLHRFGASSEKSPDQHEMFNEAELSVVAEEALTENESTTEVSQGKSQKKPGRKPLPVHLPRIRIEHDLSEEEKLCPCGCERTLIGEECSEQLDIIPAKIQVIVNVRKKYACKVCEEGVKIAPMPPQPIPKSNASPGLLAHIVISKYQDALPLHRQETVLSRTGIEIPRNTLASWMIKSGDLIQPLLNLLEDSLLAYPVMHCDETGLQVLKEPDKTALQKSYMWVRVGGPPTQPVRLFHYADSRRGEVVSNLLAGYQGYLQTDDYAGYNAVCAEKDITQLGCWAHARRKFIEAQKANAGENKKAGKADMAVSLIRQLYVIEKKIKDEAPENKYTIRQQESVPQLKKIRTWLDKSLHSTLPKGLLGKAMAYLDKNWNKLTVYTGDGRLCIDNNPAENAIRPFVIGRKNWLFSASVQGAKSSANLYSLIETAKANGLEPYAYLKYVFKELPAAQSVEAIEALLPWNLSKKTITTEA
ncbi:MAG: IS66 family transposase [Pseudomonadales bacterium]